MTFLPLHSVLNHIDPVALVVVPLMIYASDGHATLAIGVLLNELGKRLRNILFGMVSNA